MQIGSLGDIIFEVSSDKVLTPTEFSRERKARYEQHNVLGALPRLEYLSADLAEVNLPLRLRADFGVDPVREFERIGECCKEGKVLRLILCGVSYGQYVIESYSQQIRYGQSRFVQAMDVTLKLKEYV